MGKHTRQVSIGNILVGGGAPVSVQSMCATHTRDVEATAAQVIALAEAGADVVRIAVDSERDVEALAGIRRRVGDRVALSVDLQESYRLAERVAPLVDKIRYNPGHLHHHERDRPVAEKVRDIVGWARRHRCALRIGVNCGSVDPEVASRYPGDSVGAMVESAGQHCRLVEEQGFDRFVVSLKDSDPRKVLDANRRFSAVRPDVPLHLGVTEAGLPPGGVMKTRQAFEPLLAAGIGDTLRVSLTLPNERKPDEVLEGRRILDDVAAGRLTAGEFREGGLNIISCPSCSRVENGEFVELAEKVRDLTAALRDHDITIAVMGCRVNGPGETDDADLGLWCGPTHVNLKRGPEKVGAFRYDEVLARLKLEIDALIAAKSR